MNLKQTSLNKKLNSHKYHTITINNLNLFELKGIERLVDTLANNIEILREHRKYWPLMIEADRINRRATCLYDEIKCFNLKWHHTLYDKPIKRMRKECVSIDQEIKKLHVNLDLKETNKIATSNAIFSLSKNSMSAAKNLNLHTMLVIDKIEKRNIVMFFSYSISLLMIFLFAFTS